MIRNRRTTRLLVEPPASATGDIAFNLIVFFLVCASVQPDSGRSQTIPRSEQKQEQEDKEHIEVQIKRKVALLNGTVLAEKEFEMNLKKLLANKTSEEDRVVVVKSDKDVPYKHWIRVTEIIERAGGIITIQTEEERQVMVD